MTIEKVEYILIGLFISYLIALFLFILSEEEKPNKKIYKINKIRGRKFEGIE